MRRPTVRTEAVVVITEPVDGSSRRAYSRLAHIPSAESGPIDSVLVSEAALETARALCGPYQRIILVSQNVVEVVNR